MTTAPGAAPPVPPTQDTLLTRFTISPRHDDQAMPDEDAKRVCEMRHLAKERMADYGFAAAADDVTLLISELVTNAIQHSHGTHITVELHRDDSDLRIAVTDETARFPKIREPTPYAEDGRGLILVQGITDEHNGSWGVSDDGTTTWCKIPVGSC
ncbi:ATP-binding protein [Streptomyces sp. 21So2-11]|uniref:ATP-binding protein n=1 Tax=Streptomyces sp. 21So2-11 TaxID=3144408 RepID=UPI0032194D1F